MNYSIKNKNLICSFFVLSAFLISVPSFAKECDDMENQGEMNNCSHEHYKRIDARLNKLYEKLYAETSKKNQKLLNKARQSFEKYREY